MRGLRDAVVRQPPGRRYPILWLSAHFLGAVLNLAAMSLLSVMAAEQTDRRLRRRLSIALMLGFTTASSWGPFYVSVSVILTAIPEVSWIDIAPLGLGLSILMLAVGWAYDRLFLRQAPTVTERPSGPSLGIETIGRAAVILLLLSMFVLGAHLLAGPRDCKFSIALEIEIAHNASEKPSSAWFKIVNYLQRPGLGSA